jgi:hypothetical protein
MKRKNKIESLLGIGPRVPLPDLDLFFSPLKVDKIGGATHFKLCRKSISAPQSRV